MQSIAKDPHAARFMLQEGDVFLVTKKYDPQQPRGPKGSPEGGRWVKDASSGAEHWVGEGKPPADPRTFTSEEGYQWHEQGPVAEWAKALPREDAKQLDNYSGFGYTDINNLRRGTYKPPTVAHFVRASTEEEHKASTMAVDEEYLKHAPHPFGRSPYQRTPDEPYERVLDAEGNYVGHIEVNQYYTNPLTGEKEMYSVQRAGPDLKRLAEVQQQADAIDDLIASRGYTLTEPITVERGAYLPGVSFEMLQGMQYEGPNGEPPPIWEEKGFTSTMVGEAERRAHSYPALGKWESLHRRYGSANSLAHQDEVGTAVRFHIVLPAGTKVAAIEPVRRLRYEFPKVPNPEPPPANDKFWEEHPELWTKTDYEGTPTVDASGLQDKHSRSESEILIGSGAQFRVIKTGPGYTYHTGDPTLKPVETREVWLEYIGGGSSEGRRTH